MNIFKSNSQIRLLAFFLVGVILVCTFGFTVDGWSIGKETDEGFANGDITLDENSASVDESETTENEVEEIYIPKYTNYLTGLETSEEMAKKRAVALVLNANTASYGVSFADILAELPIENGNTRFLAFISNISNIGKIGSITPTRDYISNIANYLNSSLACYGSDDRSSYDDNTYFDFTQNSGYHYSEFERYQYTNSDLLISGMSNTGISDSVIEKNMPYLFNDFSNSPISFDTKAEKISVSFSDYNLSEFRYSKETGEYIFSKNGDQKKDSLNGKLLYYTNCLVLFADSVIYENASGEEMIMNTDTYGTGYYFTNGSVCSITWTSDGNGNMSLLDSSGELLTINRGRSYIAFVKSSRIPNVTFE